MIFPQITHKPKLKYQGRHKAPYIRSDVPQELKVLGLSNRFKEKEGDEKKRGTFVPSVLDG